MHPAELLWSHHHPRGGYPAGVLRILEPIPGTSFFPGGYGLWRPDPSHDLPAFPVNQVMVLGHDFHSETGYRESLKRGHEASTQPTWRDLLSFLKRVGITPESCFFTNAYMGLRAGDRATGPFPGAADEAFVEHCVHFLAEQLRTQRPVLILTLGINVPPLLGRLAPELSEWMEAKGLKHLDRVGPVKHDVAFPAAPGFRSTVVALTHPSLRSAGVRHRRCADKTGDDAEIAMVEEARRRAGLPRTADPSWSYYPETVLHFGGRHDFAVDLRSPLSASVRTKLAALQLSSCFAVVTASNPYGIDAGDRENDGRHAAFLEEIRDAGVSNTPVTGASPDGVHREEGFALSISRDRARDLATRHEQSAFFWFDGREFWIVPTAVDDPAVRLPVA
jgi:hypothetical protein